MTICDTSRKVRQGTSQSLTDLVIISPRARGSHVTISLSRGQPLRLTHSGPVKGPLDGVAQGKNGQLCPLHGPVSAHHVLMKPKRPCPGSIGGHPHGYIFYKRKGVLYCHYCSQPLVTPSGARIR